MMNIEPPSQKKRPPTQETVDKTPAFLMHLEDRTEHVRALVDSFVRQFKALDDEERRSFLVRVNQLLSALVTQVLALARNRGDEDDVRQELTIHLRQSWNDADGEFDYGKYVSAINNALSVLQAYLERAGMLLTFQPVPADFSEQLIDGIMDDIRELAEEKARVELEARRRDQTERFQALMRSGKLSQEALAAMPEREREMIERLMSDKFSDALDEFEGSMDTYTTERVGLKENGDSVEKTEIVPSIDIEEVSDAEE